MFGSMFRRIQEMTNPYCKTSFSQDAEDRVLAKFFEQKKEGFYVEVGAYHPDKFSNTRIFYNRGWKGIVIDPAPGLENLFKKKRPKDIFVPCGVGKVREKKTFHTYEEGAWNTFSDESHRIILQRGFPRHIRDVDIQILPLSEILKSKLPQDQHIDFLCIDAEGFDEAVLESNDWDSFRPDLVISEEGSEDIFSTVNSSSTLFLKSKGYRPIAKTTTSTFYSSIPH